MTVQLYIDGAKHPFKQWKFPGGEVGVKVDPMPDRYGMLRIDISDIPTSDDIFVAMNLLDALCRMQINKTLITLHMSYLPYARQDRVCSEGESFALDVFIRMLTSMRHTYGTISFDDVHSNVTLDVLDKCAPSLEVKHFEQNFFTDYLPAFDVIIAPDKGAASKAANTQPLKQHIYLSKVRMNGEVLYEDYAFDTIVGTACILDDICDGGATFLAAGEMLRDTQPRMTDLSLYVTHGIFSKGLDKLNEVFDNVYVSNLMNYRYVNDVIMVPF